MVRNRRCGRGLGALVDMVTDSNHYYARAYLSEARSRRDDPVNSAFYWRLLQWAANCRLRIIAESRQVVGPPAQGGLF